jgi:hypothetical protein
MIPPAIDNALLFWSGPSSCRSTLNYAYHAVYNKFTTRTMSDSMLTIRKRGVVKLYDCQEGIPTDL